MSCPIKKKKWKNGWVDRQNSLIFYRLRGRTIEWNWSAEMYFYGWLKRFVFLVDQIFSNMKEISENPRKYQINVYPYTSPQEGEENHGM